jgi:GTP-binding protein HflX
MTEDHPEQPYRPDRRNKREGYDTQAVAGLRAILIGITNRKTSAEQAQEYISELAFLASTASIQAVHTILQPMDTPLAATFVGTGKLEEIKTLKDTLAVNLIIFDDELTPTQARNIERVLECPIMDRSALILDIFQSRAQTAQARTQVELARLQYQLPRLTRLWTHLSRERGGIGLKGAGEQEIETDRRIIRDRIARLKKELEQIDRQNETRRKNRDLKVRVALVGYTNAGKSTLMNVLSKADVLAENKLFATLDTTVRKIVIHNTPMLLSDTVGFIRKLPHHLIESFKSTLDEVREADILLHVCDVSSQHYIEQLKVVRNTLDDLKASDKPTIMVFNKVDMISADDIEDLRLSWKNSENTYSAFISALSKDGIEELKNLLVAIAQEVYATKYPGIEYYAYY